MIDAAFHYLEWFTVLVDFIGYGILIFTVVKFVIRYVAFEFKRLRGLECVMVFRDIRTEFLSHVILAIDFMVVSDVIHTGLVQDRESLITLGIFVLIRSLLAFFLGLDMREIREEAKDDNR
ncbi:MAG: DUF1622 domain-containing protein [Pseudomonadota bacterium]